MAKVGRKLGGTNLMYNQKKLLFPGEIVPEKEHNDILYKLLKIGLPREILKYAVSKYGYTNLQAAYEKIKVRWMQGQVPNSPNEVITLFNICLSEVVGRSVENGETE